MPSRNASTAPGGGAMAASKPIFAGRAYAQPAVGAVANAASRSRLFIRLPHKRAWPNRSAAHHVAVRLLVLHQLDRAFGELGLGVGRERQEGADDEHAAS